MLSQLYIENIAVIEKTTVEFKDGFNILTGETGAGKSILIDAINAVLGFRVSKDIIRTGEKKAFVSALFSGVSDAVSSLLLELGYNVDDDNMLLLSREISYDGKSSCKVQGKPATVGVLKEIGQVLINIHGQHDNQSLLSPEKHIYFLDGYANLSQMLSNYTSVYDQLCEIDHQIDHLSSDENEKARKLDMLQFQIDEIMDANLEPDEEETLNARKKLIKNSSKILESVSTSINCLNGTEEYSGICELISTLEDSLLEAAKYADNFTAMSLKVKEMAYELLEYSSDLRDFLDDFDFDPRELNEIETRLDLIYKLKRKYGSSISEILDFLKNAQEEFDNINLSDIKIKALTEEREKIYKKAITLAKQISELRKNASKEFSQSIMDELSFLNMTSAVFDIAFTETSLTRNGIDSIEFLLSANPGETLKSLSKIASGGELSRIMLAMKNVIAKNDDVETLIFDEIDTGVSGKAAQKIGQKLKQVSKVRQVICITHLSQIASLADNHFLIEKLIKDDRSYTNVKELDHNGRVMELARIISGDQITELTIKNAEEMLRSN